MNGQWIDLAIIAVVGLSVLTGLFRGFVKEVIALAAWVLSIWMGVKYSALLDPWLSQYLADKSIRAVAAFLIIMFGVLLVGGVVNAVLSFILKQAGLSGTDRTLGMGFGFVRGVFIVALIMMAIRMTSLPYEEYRKESSLYARFDPVVDLLYGYMPEFIKQMKVVESKEEVVDIERIDNA